MSHRISPLITRKIPSLAADHSQTNSQIAKQLGISLRTLGNYLTKQGIRRPRRGNPSPVCSFSSPVPPSEDISNEELDLRLEAYFHQKGWGLGYYEPIPSGSSLTVAIGNLPVGDRMCPFHVGGTRRTVPAVRQDDVKLVWEEDSKEEWV